MRYRVFVIALLLVLAFTLSASAFAVTIKPVDDPWNDPNCREPDGENYIADNSAGYVVVWETPECNVDGKYVIINNGTKLTVQYRVTYMDDIPWGYVSLKFAGEDSFDGWILMSDLLTMDGKRAWLSPHTVPSHPIIENPEPTATAQPTPPPSTEPTPSQEPARPDEAITISNTYNTAIVYTSVGIAVFALALVAFVLIRHKAVNKKGE